MFSNEFDKHGIRIVWNATPKTKAQQVKYGIPNAIHYTPFAQIQMPVITSIPIRCVRCDAILNSHCKFQPNSMRVQCCFCLANMQLPQQNKESRIVPSQLLPQNATFTYQQKQEIPDDHSYLFLIDLCLQTSELQAIKESLVQVIKKLENHISIGIIAFNRYIQVIDFNSKFDSQVNLLGELHYEQKLVWKMLGINPQHQPHRKCNQLRRKYFIKMDTEENVEKVIKKINKFTVDPFMKSNKQMHQRPYRPTGQALSVAISMTKFMKLPSRVIALVGGPCTLGPGAIIAPSYSKQMRSLKDYCPNYNESSPEKFYQQLSDIVTKNGIIIDFFMMHVEQFGITEMRPLIKSCGGYLIMHEQFNSQVFRQSIQKFFLNQQIGGFKKATNATLSIKVSEEIVINGILGNCKSMIPTDAKYPRFAQKQIGQGKTNLWYLGGLDTDKTYTVIYEIKQPAAYLQSYFVQFQTRYFYKNSYYRRVTTIRKQWSDDLRQIVQNFDQQAATVMLARLSGYKFLNEKKQNLRGWLDDLLVRWSSSIATYVKNKPTSFMLSSTTNLLPQYLFHLRKLAFVRNYGSSLDEMFYVIFTLNRESVHNSLMIIQPALLTYSVQHPQAIAAILDAKQMKSQVILLQDSYFNVVLWYGQHIKYWLQEGFAQKPQYTHIKQLFQNPNSDANIIIKGRFPTPAFYKVNPGHSKQRFIKARMNIGQQFNQGNLATQQDNLVTFTQNLVSLVVSGKGKNAKSDKNPFFKWLTG